MTGIDIDTGDGTDAGPSRTDGDQADRPASELARDDHLGPEVRPPARPRRVSKWDRPPPPHDWRWYVGMLGRTLIAVGVLMFGFVAYQLWGTGIENAAAQRALEDDFEELLAQFDPVTEPSTTDQSSQAPTPTTPVQPAPDATPAADAADEPATPDPTAQPDQSATPAQPATPATPDEPPTVLPVAEQNLPPVADGDAIARIEIPRIGVNEIVVAGVDIGDLKRGPGHFPDTPLPGQLGNAAIAGHRTTYGAPFFEVDQLEPGDEVRVTTLNGLFTYRVTATEIVAPSAYRVVATTDPTVASLTLVSCHPRYTARQRIIVSAVLDPDASGVIGEPVLNYGRPEPAVVTEAPPATAPPTSAPASAADEPTLDDPATDLPADAAEPTEPAETPTPESVPAAEVPSEVEPTEPLTTGGVGEDADVFSKGWFSDPAANAHVGFWGALLTLVAVVAYLLSRRVRRDWVGAAVGIVPFVVVLYFFFQNVNRLLPPAL